MGTGAPWRTDMGLLNCRKHPNCDRDTFFRTLLEAARALRTSSAGEHCPSPMACAARAEPGGDLQATLQPQPPNLLSFHDIELHGLPIPNAAQKLPGVVSLNSCLVKERPGEK